MQTNSALMAESLDDVNILLVDDQPNNLLALDAMLSDMGSLVKADSGRKALKNLLDHDFAVILLDVQMPELDGFETANLIREREKSRDTPIIFLTALSRSETNIYKGYSLGAVDYLFKPFNPEILRSKVSVFVELFRKNQALRRQAHELARLSKQNDLILKSAAEGVFGVDARSTASSTPTPAGI
jgi:CheY-like chemotaxis protein